MRIVSVTVNAIGPFVGRNVIEFDPGMTVVYGRNGTGKSVLFRGMRGWFHGVSDVSSLPGWLANAADPRGAWSDVGRVLVEVEGEEAGACTFMDDERIASLGEGIPAPFAMGDHGIYMLGVRFARRLERIAGDYLERRRIAPALRSSDGVLVMTGLENAPSGIRTIAALAFALALRDVRSPRSPLVIDDGGLGMLDRPLRAQVARELTGLDGQVILFTSVDDVAERLGIDYVLAPVRHARGIRVRRYTRSRQRPVV